MVPGDIPGIGGSVLNPEGPQTDNRNNRNHKQQNQQFPAEFHLSAP
jgi:hypothetical protein